MRTYKYLFVWDDEKAEIIASYFVVKQDMKPEDYPRDTKNGGVLERSEQDFVRILSNTYPSPKYRICGGYAQSLNSLVDNYFGLVDKDYDFEGEKDYLCVWDIKDKKIVECYMVSDTNENKENVKTVSHKSKDALFEELKKRYGEGDFFVVFVTALSLKEVNESLRTINFR